MIDPTSVTWAFGGGGGGVKPIPTVIRMASPLLCLYNIVSVAQED